jgi:hypothetical protein
VSKLMNEDYKIKYLKTSRIKYMRVSRPNIRGHRSFLLRETGQVSFNILNLYFSIYSVELELHDRSI